MSAREKYRTSSSYTSSRPTKSSTTKTTNVSGGGGGDNREDRRYNQYKNVKKTKVVEDKSPKKKINKKQKKFLNYIGKETKKVPAATLKKKLGEVIIGGTATGFLPYMVGSGIYGLGKKIFNKEPIIQIDKSSSLKDYDFKDIKNQVADALTTPSEGKFGVSLNDYNKLKNTGYSDAQIQELQLNPKIDVKEVIRDIEGPIFAAADGGAIRKNFSIGSNGILDLDETEGEEISLTAEGPQFTEEEKLRMDSEDEEEDEKRIDLFASETGEADPLNNLLLGENGITTLFQAKDGGSPQLVKKSKDGKRPGYRGPGGYQSGQSDPASDQGETSSDSGFGGGNQNIGGGGNNYTGGGADQEDDVAQMMSDMNLTPDNAPDYTGSDLGFVVSEDEEKEYGGSDYASIEQIKDRADRRKKDYKNQQKKDLAIFGIKALFTGINPFGVFNFARKQEAKKNEYLETLEEDIQALKDKGVPTYSPHTDTLVQTLEQEYLDLTQPKTKDDDNEPDGDAYIKEIMASNQVIEERDETDIFNIWDKIKAKQAQRAMLVEKGIIQDNTQDQTMMLNSGGLANLFRVKTQ